MSRAHTWVSFSNVLFKPCDLNFEIFHFRWCANNYGTINPQKMLYFVHIFPCILLFTPSHASRTQSVDTGPNIANLQVQQPEGTRLAHEVQFDYRITANRKGHLTCEVILSSEARQTIAKDGNQSLSHVYLRCPQVFLGLYSLVVVQIS